MFVFYCNYVNPACIAAIPNKRFSFSFSFFSTRCRAKPNVSPPGCATSRLRPATHMHYYSHRTLTPSTECHQNSVIWIKQTKLVAMATSAEGSKSNFRLIVYSRVDREWMFIFPFPPIPMQSIPFLPIHVPKFKSYSHSRGILVGYSHSHPIPKHAQQNNKMKIQSVNSRATGKQFHGKLNISG